MDKQGRRRVKERRNRGSKEENDIDDDNDNTGVQVTEKRRKGTNLGK